MKNDQSSTAHSKSFAVWRLRQVAKIALLTWGGAVVCLLVAVWYLVGEEGRSYFGMLNLYVTSHRQLVPTLLLAGVALTALAGLTTWVAALYSTHRIAGPLARFSRNLKRQIQDGPLPLQQLQAGHLLQEEHLHYSAATSRLQYHYDSMSELTDLAVAQLALPTPNLGGGLTTTLQRLRDLGEQVKLPPPTANMVPHPLSIPDDTGQPTHDHPEATPAPERLYVDFKIQMRLLITLLLLEATLTVGSIAYLYFRFKAIIEDNLYRMHYAVGDLSPLLLNEAGEVLFVMLLINLVCLLVADRVWVRYVQRVLQTFTHLAAKVADMDFRPDLESSDQHAALDLMLAWRQKERGRVTAVAALLQQLDLSGDFTTPQTQAHLQGLLHTLRLLLPKYSRRFVGHLDSSHQDRSPEGHFPHSKPIDNGGQHNAHHSHALSYGPVATWMRLPT